MDSEVKTLYDLTPDTVIKGRYRIVKPHRQGGLSAAFEVVDQESGETCELQFFPAGLFEIPEQIEEFMAILTPWKLVTSDAVLRVRNILSIGPGGLALVTDLTRGESLRKRLNREERIPPEEVIRIGCHALDGLVAIHSRSLVHGDIKPYTIHLLDGGAEVVLVDGGLTPGLWTAKGLGDKTALIGTPYYAPIEQFGGESPDMRSDIYNVATVLFESVCGALPWAGKSFLEVFQAKLDKKPPSIRKRAPKVKVDRELERVIVRGCLADRKERYATAEEFRSALGALA